MDMVERVARAIYPSMFAHSDYEDVPFDEAMSRPRYVFLKEQVTMAARAAIAAMREPTEGMVEASYGMFRPEEDWLTKREAKDVWQAMIDAALKSTEPQE